MPSPLELDHSNTTFALADPADLFLSPALSGFLLGLRLRITSNGGLDPAAGYTIQRMALRVLQADATLQQRLVTVLQPASFASLKLHAGGYATETYFEGLVSAALLERMEECRAGEDLKLTLELQTLVSDRRGDCREGSRRPREFVVSRTHWLAQLRASGVTDTLVFEVPLPTVVDSGAEDPTHRRSLGEAFRLFQAGNYDQCVAQLRPILAALRTANAPGAEKARQRTLPQRWSVLANAVHELASAAHHAEEFGTDDMVFGRAGARTMLVMTATLLSARPADSG